MPRIPARTGKQVVRILQAHGFILDHVTGSHNIFVHENGKRISVPVHNRDLPKGTLNEILKYAGIRSDEI